MIVLLIGGQSAMTNALIDKFNKNGHKVYLLTGQREDNSGYRRVFEKYNFPYDSGCISEVLESVKPDITVFMGAYDTNFDWDDGAQEVVRYTSGLMNILSSFDTLRDKGKFFYFSSEDVFCETYTDNITEETAIFPAGFKAKAIAQGEEMCENFRRVEGLQTIVLRLDCVYWIPGKGEHEDNPAYKMIIEALKAGRISANGRRAFSMIFLNDAVEQLYELMCSKTLRYSCYNISSAEEINESQLAEIVKGELHDGVDIANNTVGAGNRVVLSNDRFNEEFNVKLFNSVESGVKKVASHMKRNSSDFVRDDDSGAGERLRKKVGRAFRILVPYLENVVCFLFFYWLVGRTAESQFFERLDFYLLYVLLFAVIYGQHQAIFSGLFAVIGFCLGEMSSRSGFEVLLDFNTYVWMAQLFIVGLVVGYLRDRLRAVKNETDSRVDYLHGQLKDIQEINDSNVRIKQNYETQVVNHKDSLGKIYEISSSLEQYEPAEVLFYAAQAISNLMDSDDVAVYTVANEDYARLFSATSKEARQLGNSVKYSALQDMWEQLMDRRVYINRDMTQGLPSMAAPVYSKDGLELILMLWDLPWDRMTLGEANRLTIVGAMIQNAIVRANRYMEALRNRRYLAGTNVLDTDAFTELVKAFSGAREKGLTDYTLVEILADNEDYEKAAEMASSAIRPTDYIGILADGSLCVLLTNTNAQAASVIIDRFKNAGYDSQIKGN